MKPSFVFILAFILSVSFVLAQDLNRTTVAIMSTPAGKVVLYFGSFNTTAYGKSYPIIVALGLLYCETSNASPLVTDIHIAVSDLKAKRSSLNRWCKNTSAGWSHCTKIKDYGSAAIGICGDYGFKMYCDAAGVAAADIADTCAENLNGGRRAGGYIQYDGGRIIVYHAS